MVGVLLNFVLYVQKKRTHMRSGLCFSRYEVGDLRRQTPKEVLAPDFCPHGVFTEDNVESAS